MRIACGVDLNEKIANVVGVATIGGISELFDAPRRIAVPGLAPWAMPEMLIGFEAAGGAAIAHQRPRGLVERPLHGLVVLLMREALARQPARGRDQRGLVAQV